MAPIGRPLAETIALYDRIAESYQRQWAPAIEPAALRLLDLVAPVVDGRPEAVLLDIGAGTGPLVRAAVARWPQVRAIAVDPSAGMLELGRAIAVKTLGPAARDRLTWQVGQAERLRIADGSADVVLSSFMLQYLPNRSAGLREAHRALRPGGTVAVVTWLDDDRPPFEPWELLAELLDDLQVERPASAEPGIFRSLPSASALFRRAGFRDVHAAPGVVEVQWTLEPLVRYAFETRGVEVADRLDPSTRDRLERRWRERLTRLPAADLRDVSSIVYVTGRRPA